uniref:Uncharacterized protein n=1 Tax=Tetranychus urticae TaxID=32264 RepID=T1KPW8_TETUR
MGKGQRSEGNTRPGSSCASHLHNFYHQLLELQ